VEVPKNGTANATANATAVRNITFMDICT
jgi:hypothetical protein